MAHGYRAYLVGHLDQRGDQLVLTGIDVYSECFGLTRIGPRLYTLLMPEASGDSYAQAREAAIAAAEHYLKPQKHLFLW